MSDESFYEGSEAEGGSDFEYDDDDAELILNASQSDSAFYDDEFDEGPEEDDGRTNGSKGQKQGGGSGDPTIEFKAHSIEALIDKLSAQTTNISNVLELTNDQSLTLLQFFSWNSERLMEEYMDDPERVKTAAGVVDDIGKGTSTYKKYPRRKFTCMICCEEKKESYQLSCQHEYCLDCYRIYVKDKTSAGKVIKCMDCDVALNSQDLDFIAGEGESFKLIESSIREYVERHKTYKWCPSVDCPCVIEILNLVDVASIVKNNDIPVVTCKFEHQFCVNCNYENHNPAPCAVAEKWIAKCKDDSETANWIMSNTQQCAKCESSIEKNGGCNHMTCKKCGYEFCWICLEDWTKHGGDFYNCTRYKESETRKNSYTNRQQLMNSSKSSLKRYLHYYNLYAVHESSTKLDDKRCKFVEEKVRELQETSGISWIEAQFLVESAQVLLKARRVLKWSYAMAYYCDKSNYLELFEDVQAKLAQSVENLSKLFEIDDPLRIVQSKLEFLNKSHYLVDRQNGTTSCTKELLNNGALSFKDI